MVRHGNWLNISGMAARRTGRASDDILMSQDTYPEQEILLKVMSRESLSGLLGHATAMEKSSGLEPWGEENFLVELPDKWRLSRWVCSKHSDVPMGYAVISRKSPSNVHLHRFVISETGRGFGAFAIQRILGEIKDEAAFFTVFTSRSAHRAQKFYESNGFFKLMNVYDDILYIHTI